MRLPFDGTYGISRPFGEGPDPAYANYPGSVHPGEDYPLAYHTPLYAAQEGITTPIHRTDGWKGRGNEVVITNGPVQVKTCHMSQIVATNGQWVKEGQLIGYSGNTGYVLPRPTIDWPKAGSHLHVELLINSTYRALSKYIKEEEVIKADKGVVIALWTLGFGRPPTDQELKNNVGRDVLLVLDEVASFAPKSSEGIVQTRQRLVGAESLVEKLKDQISNSTGVDPKYVDFARATEKLLKG